MGTSGEAGLCGQLNQHRHERGLDGPWSGSSIQEIKSRSGAYGGGGKPSALGYGAGGDVNIGAELCH